MIKKEPDIINYDLPEKLVLFELQSYIGSIEKDASLYEEKSFDKRMEIIDFIGLQVIDQLGELMQKTAQPGKLVLLKTRAEKIKAELEEIDINLFQRLQATVRAGGYRGNEFKNLVNEYVNLNSGYNEHQEEAAYDNLDIFINRLSPFQAMPGQTKELEPGMIYYQKTPARIVFEFVQKAHFRKEDVFFDLGAGLGQVAILVNLLTGIPAKGVEFEPAYCNYADNCAAQLNLSDVTFINADARKADFSEGTVFFMFTPFRDEILREVLEILRKESLRRKIKIITYGPCTTEVALQTWLESAPPGDNNIYKPAFFRSF